MAPFYNIPRNLTNRVEYCIISALLTIMILIDTFRRHYDRLLNRFGKRVVWGVGALAVILIGVGIFFGAGKNDDNLQTNGKLRTVTVSSVSKLSRETSLSLIGEVEAINQAEVASEVSGRVVWVPVQLGSNVATGQVIAQFENSRERASVLQAEGFYEAALANTAEAESDGLNEYREAYSVANDAILNTVDDLFSLPQSSRPRFLINKSRFTDYIEDERVVIGKILDDWEFSLFSPYAVDTEALAVLDMAEKDIPRIIEYVSRVIDAVARQDADARFSEAVLSAHRSALFTAQMSLNSTLSSLQGARADLLDASVGGNNVSAAYAAVKQALGSLQLAQSALEKTIVRAPVSGTVNTLDVKVGDFVSIQKRVALVANNSGLEITTFVGEEDLTIIAPGDEVIIDGTITGHITVIAPALHPDTKKIEVRIRADSDGLKNGDTVRIEIFEDASESQADTEIAVRIPLTAVKLTADSAYVFTVSDVIMDPEGSRTGVIVANEVTLGRASGQRVEIKSGLSPEIEIVVDARGLNEGVHVDIK